MKIVILDGYTENPGDLSWNGIEMEGDLTVYDRTSLSDESEILNRIGDAEVVFTNKTPLSESILKLCPNLKFIGVLATGYDIVDIECAREQGIGVSNVPAYGTASVSQFAISLLLEICANVGDHSLSVHNGDWEKCKDFCYWNHKMIELTGKTMGIIGFGRIGQATGRIANSMGMKVLANDTFKMETENQIAEYVSLDRILEESDVIVLHCPLFPETKGLIRKETIEKMKDGVIIINNSRGPLIVEQDLADALNSGKVYAAAVDVVSTEPIRGDNPLLKAKNCFITPHISWATKESRQRIMDCSVENLKAYKNGKPINLVN